MNSLRPELLELTPQALTALSNAGFVKRSLKELENGNVPEISHENGALIATFSDGVRTQLANGQALKEAQCSCGASGMCRHRVMLILSYQRANAGNALAEAEPESAERWHPGQWQEELATLPESILKRAQQLADKGITVGEVRQSRHQPVISNRVVYFQPQHRILLFAKQDLGLRNEVLQNTAHYRQVVLGRRR